MKSTGDQVQFFSDKNGTLLQNGDLTFAALKGKGKKVYLSGKMGEKLEDKVDIWLEVSKPDSNVDYREGDKGSFMRIDGGGVALCNMVDLNMDVENVDQLLVDNVKSTIHQNNQYSTRYKAASQACVHKTGVASESNVTRNILKKDMYNIFKLFLEQTDSDDTMGTFVNIFKSYKKSSKGNFIRCEQNESPEYFKIIKPLALYFPDYIADLEQLIGEEINKRIKYGIYEAFDQAINYGYYAYGTATSRRSGDPHFSIGPPGTHSEVIATNETLNNYYGHNATQKNMRSLTQVTHRLAPGSQKGSAFPACQNCTIILDGKMRIPTGSQKQEGIVG